MCECRELRDGLRGILEEHEVPLGAHLGDQGLLAGVAMLAMQRFMLQEGNESLRATLVASRRGAGMEGRDRFQMFLPVLASLIRDYRDQEQGVIASEAFEATLGQVLTQMFGVEDWEVPS